MTDDSRVVLVADTSVLINLIITGRLVEFAGMKQFRLIVPDEVVKEVRRPEQRMALEQALAGGMLELYSVDAVECAGILLALADVLGAGELACLALAELNGWTVASDEKRRFRREAIARLGAERLIGTVELYWAAITSGVLTAVEADADKAVLERHRFRLGFGSFVSEVTDITVG